jgi:hypothetical protein
MFRIGDAVLFGRTHGEKTAGRVVGINGKSIKVEQTEERGGRPVGTVWRVAPALVYPVEGAPSRPTRTPAKAQAPARVGQRVSFTAKGRTVTGTVVRVNDKTVTVEDCDDGSRGWRVSPSMLHNPATI